MGLDRLKRIIQILTDFDFDKLLLKWIFIISQPESNKFHL